MKRYAVACRTEWFWDAFDAAELPGQWLKIRTPQELTLEALTEFGPRYIFFPHWSQIVPDLILERFECVCFHTAPLPWGRGGSPVQNQIARGKESSELCALQMTSEVDGGPIYLRRAVSLLGGGDEIFQRISDEMVPMIAAICQAEPLPNPQQGEPTVFKRRRPRQSRIPKELNLRQLFDHIRMLDAEGYPRAYAKVAGFRLELSRPALRRGRIEADVVITPLDKE